MPIETDTIQYGKHPIYHLKIVGDLKKNDMTSFYSAFRQCFEAASRFGLVFDFQKLDQITVPYSSILSYSKQIDHYSTTDPVRINQTIAVGIITNSVMVSGMMKMIFKIRPPIAPNQIVGNLNEAVRFIYYESTKPSLPRQIRLSKNKRMSQQQTYVSKIDKCVRKLNREMKW